MNPALTPCLHVLVVLYARAGRVDDARRTREKLMRYSGCTRPVFTSSFLLDPDLAARYERDAMRLGRVAEARCWPLDHWPTGMNGTHE